MRWHRVQTVMNWSSTWCCTTQTAGGNDTAVKVSVGRRGFGSTTVASCQTCPRSHCGCFSIIALWGLSCCHIYHFVFRRRVLMRSVEVTLRPPLLRCPTISILSLSLNPRRTDPSGKRQSIHIHTSSDFKFTEETAMLKIWKWLFTPKRETTSEQSCKNTLLTLFWSQTHACPSWYPMQHIKATTVRHFTELLWKKYELIFNLMAATRLWKSQWFYKETAGWTCWN